MTESCLKQHLKINDNSSNKYRRSKTFNPDIL